MPPRPACRIRPFAPPGLHVPGNTPVTPPVTSSMQAPSATAHFSCPGGPGAAPAPDPGDTGQGPTMTGNHPPAAPALCRRLAAGYDRSTAWLEPYRHRAVSQLRLRPGEVVVDVGCGTG